MSHQVIWTKKTEHFFADMANLNETERDVLHCRVMGMTRVQTSMYLDGLSVSTIDRIVKVLKAKYDRVQQEYPDDLRPRRYSAEETYMDEH